MSAVYRAVTLRGDTMGVMPVQYRKKDFEGGNFVQDMRGLGKRINYLLQEEANPIMTAPDLWNLVELNRTLTGNGFVYIERDEFGFPASLVAREECGYNINTATYASIVYLTGSWLRDGGERADQRRAPLPEQLPLSRTAGANRHCSMLSRL